MAEHVWPDGITPDRAPEEPLGMFASEQTAYKLGGLSTGEALYPDNAERYSGMPNARESLDLTLTDKEGKQRGYAMSRIAHDYHDCVAMGCELPDIEPGEEYVVIQAIQTKRSGEDHWHVHALCFRDRVIPNLRVNRPVPSSDTTEKALYKKRRNLINNQRRRVA